VTSSPRDTNSVLELLVSIRTAQSKSIDRMSRDMYWLEQLTVDIDKLTDATFKLASAVPPEATRPQMSGLRRDVAEFKADVSAVKSYLGELATMTSGVKADMAEIKTALDILPSRVEESAVREIR